MNPPLILALNKETAVCVFFSVCLSFSLPLFLSLFFVVQPILPDAVSPLQMYFIFDLTGAPCQCTVLINRVGSPERSSLSPILFQPRWGSGAQPKGSAPATIEQAGSVTVCLSKLPPTNATQKIKNTASIAGFPLCT